MGVTAKDVGIFVWKVLKFTMKNLYYCASKYPFISCILLFFFLLYMFLPSVFTFFIYFSPLVVFAGLVHRVFLEIDRRKRVNLSRENEKKNDEISSRNLKYVENELAVGTNVGFSAGTTARRRHLIEGIIKEDNAFSSVDDKDNDLVDKSALAEENPKEIREVKVDSVIAKVVCSSSRPEKFDGTTQGYQKFANGKGETEIEKESPDDTEDDDEDEEERKERNKAVEWTEDDQKNLMDLGLSEIERNKRLESLIARRKSRKYMSLQGRRTMGSENFNAQIFSLQIPKTNPFLEGSSGNPFSPVPGSAPSVLLPNSNPFDLPYDPFEEKPNLTGGSFQQEFMVPNQRDMVFCRHESFQMSAFFPPDSKNDKHNLMHHDFFTKQRVFERPPLPTPDAEQDGKRIQQEFPPVAAPMFKDDVDSSQGKEEGAASEQVVDSLDHENEDDESDVQTKEMVVDASSSDTNSSSSFEASEPILRPNKEAILNSIRQLSRRHIVVDREVTCQTNNNESYESGSSDLEKTKSERFFQPNMGMYHTPSHSIASDLQVEVSEIGSPPLTNISSQDEVSSTNDGEMEKEITSRGSEETWDPSSQVLTERVVEQDTIDSHLLSPSKPELTESIQHCNTNSSQSVLEKDLSAIASDSLEISSFEALPVPIPENTKASTGALAVTPSDYVDSVKPEESSSPKNLERELKTSDSVSDPEIPTKNDKKDSRTELDENKGNLSNLPNETKTMSTESGAQMENQLEHEHSIDSSIPHEGEDISTSLEHLENEVHKLVQHNDVLEVSESTGNIKKPSQEREGEGGMPEPGLSVVSQGLVDSAASVSQNEVSADQISTANLEQGSTDGGASHSSGDHIASDTVVEEVDNEPNLSSPKSVLQPMFSNDQVSSPNLGEELHTGVLRSESGTGETDSLPQLQHDSLTPPATEDAAPVSNISRDGPSHEGDSIKLVDSVHPSVIIPEEVNRTSIIKESAAVEDKCKGDSQIASMLEATAELLRPGNDTDPKDTESMIEQIAETISTDPQSLPSTRQEEESNPPPEWSTDELTINPTAYDSGSEMGENGSKSVAGESECPSESITRQEEQSNLLPDWSTDELTINPTAYDSDSTEMGAGQSECPSESITRQNSVHHFSRNSEDFIEDLFSSLVGRSANASASVTRQSSAHEFSRSSEDFLQDLFKSLVSDAGGASTRVSRQGSLSESTDEMVHDMFKSLQDNPRE